MYTMMMSKEELGHVIHVAAAIHHRIGLEMHRLPGGIKVPGIWDVKEQDDKGRLVLTDLAIEIVDNTKGNEFSKRRDY